MPARWEASNLGSYSWVFGPQYEMIPILQDILHKAEAAINGTSDHIADLRFGHDTCIGPLTVLMGINGADRDPEDPYEVKNCYQNWQTCKASNMQIVFYRGKKKDGLKRLDYRMRWEADFRSYLQRLDQQKPVILCGDLNVAHEEIDIKNPKTNRRNAGFTDEERQQFSLLLESGFADTFRWKYPEQVTYSWWSYRFHAREKNAGWRIDYFVVSNRLCPQVADAKIHTDILGSDHCPVELDLA